MLNYERIKNFPTSRNGKMVYGIAAAFTARGLLDTGMGLMEAGRNDGAFISFLAAGLMLYTVGLAMVRFNTGRPLFEAISK